MKNASVMAAAAAALLFTAVPALPQEQVSFKLLGGLAGVHGDDYNRGIVGAYDFVRDTSDSISGGYKKLESGWDFQAEIVNYWGSHIGVGIGGGYYRVTNTSGLTATGGVGIDSGNTFTSTYTPKISVLPFFLNVHYKIQVGPGLGLDLFAGPVFQVVQFGFKREDTLDLIPQEELETFNASDTALGFQGGLSVSLRILRGIALVADGFYRSGKVSNIKGNWFLNTTTPSGTVTQSDSSYYFWFYDDTQGSVYPRFGFFDSAGPTGENISGARKGALNLSGLAAMIGLKFSF